MSTLDELITETTALDSAVKAWLAENRSARVAHNARYLAFLLKALREERGEHVTIEDAPVQTIVIQKPTLAPLVRWANESNESSARVLFEQGAIPEFTPEAFKAWVVKRQAEMRTRKSVPKPAGTL